MHLCCHCFWPSTLSQLFREGCSFVTAFRGLEQRAAAWPILHGKGCVPTGCLLVKLQLLHLLAEGKGEKNVLSSRVAHRIADELGRRTQATGRQEAQVPNWGGSSQAPKMEERRPWHVRVKCLPPPIIKPCPYTPVVPIYQCLSFGSRPSLTLWSRG